MKPSIHDVAKQAGVSIAAVSMAINNKPGVSQKTRSRILAVATAMGYRVDHIRKAESRVRNVALYLSGTDYNYFNTTFFTEIVKQVSITLPGTEYSTLIRYGISGRDETDFKNLMVYNPIDAIILMGRIPTEIVEEYAPDIPCVFINRPNVKGANAYSVYADNEKAAYLVTHHLLSLGHRRIAFMGYIPTIVSTTERYRGFCRAMTEANAPINMDYVYPTEHYEETGYIEMRKLLMRRQAIPSGIVCGNDLIAIGVMSALWDAGLSVPEDVSVTGIHNLPHMGMLRVPLTTVHIPHDRMGQQAAQLVMDILDAKRPKHMLHNDVSLIVRASTAEYKKRVETM